MFWVCVSQTQNSRQMMRISNLKQLQTWAKVDAVARERMVTGIEKSLGQWCKSSMFSEFSKLANEFSIWPVGKWCYFSLPWRLLDYVRALWVQICFDPGVDWRRSDKQIMQLICRCYFGCRCWSCQSVQLGVFFLETASATYIHIYIQILYV